MDIKREIKKNQPELNKIKHKVTTITKIIPTILIIFLTTPVVVNGITIEFKGGYSLFPLMNDINDLVGEGGNKLTGGYDLGVNMMLMELSEEWILGIGIGTLYGETIVSSRKEDYGSSGTVTTEDKEIAIAYPLTITTYYPITMTSDRSLRLAGEITGGVALVRYGSQIKISGTDSLSSTTNIKRYYTGFAPVIQIGIGIIYNLFEKLDISENVDIRLDVGIRYIRSGVMKDYETGIEATKSDGNRIYLDFTGIYSRIGLCWNL